MSNNEPTNQSNNPLTIIQHAGDRAIQIAQNFGEVIVENSFSIFSSVRQVVTAAAIIIACALALGFTVWTINQPRKLSGDFNIAISKFKETTNNTDIDVAESAGQLIFGYLDDQYSSSGFREVDIAYYDHIDPVVETEEVIDLMEKTNADLVIYGEVRVIDDEAVIIPEFYVTEDFQFDVLSGRHEVELPVQFEVSDLVDPESSVNARLPQKFAILTEFTKGLVYFAAEKLDLSTDAMEKAVDYMKEYGEFKGGEVIYLLASNNARLQEEFDRSQTLLDEAFLMNPNYGRGYIAQGNIYYDQENLYQAALTYQQALTLEDQNKDAYIVEKASLNLGNIYVYQYQETVLNPDALETEKNELAQLALDSYQVVIDAYNRQDKKDRRLKGLTAWAYYGTGIVHQVKGQYDQAAQALEQALDLTTESDLIERATRRLNEVTQE